MMEEDPVDSETLRRDLESWKKVCESQGHHGWGPIVLDKHYPERDAEWVEIWKELCGVEQDRPTSQPQSQEEGEKLKFCKRCHKRMARNKVCCYPKVKVFDIPEPQQSQDSPPPSVVPSEEDGTVWTTNPDTGEPRWLRKMGSCIIKECSIQIDPPKSVAKYFGFNDV